MSRQPLQHLWAKIFWLLFQGLPGPDGREGIPGLPGSKVTLTMRGLVLPEP